MRTLQVEITERDILDGVPNDSVNNPVALAIARDFQRLNPGCVFVTPEEVLVGDQLYTPSREMTKWLIRYNNGKRVKPLLLGFEELVP